MDRVVPNSLLGGWDVLSATSTKPTHFQHLADAVQYVRVRNTNHDIDFYNHDLDGEDKKRTEKAPTKIPPSTT